MANDYFQFRQFTVWQDRCAMKVGTDGTLLGAWSLAPIGECRILDIGTGTGLVALMMAQRYPNATVLQKDVRNMSDAQGFDAIISNPPYFVDSLSCPDPQRNTARHTDSLSYHDLMYAVSVLLKESGIFSVIIPEESVSRLESEANVNGMFKSRIFHIHTTPRKAPKRCLIEFSKNIGKQCVIENVVLEDAPGSRSNWYHQLTKDFYIR